MKRRALICSWSCCLLVLLLIPWISLPWVDEVGTSDTAVNLTLNGQWISHCWTYSYNILHLFVLTVWLKLFGVSHFTVCALNVVLAGAAFHILYSVIHRRGWQLGGAGNFLLIVLYWFGWRSLPIFVMGRIDVITMIFAVLLADGLLDLRASKCKIFLYAFFCMAGAVYPMPLFFAFSTIQVVWPCYGIARSEMLKRFVAVAFGTASAFVVACAVYALEGQLIRFVHTYFSFSATLSGAQVPFVRRLFDAYMLDWSFVFLIIMSGFVCVRMKDGFKNSAFSLIFISAIPLLMVMAGRYAVYYTWVAYIPVLIMTVCCIGRSTGVPFRIVACMMACFIAAVTLLSNIRYVNRSDIQGKYSDFVASHANVLDGVRDVVIMDYQAYYSVVASGRIVWMTNLETDMSPREKFNAFLNKKVHSEKWRECLLCIYGNVQKDLPASPTAQAVAIVSSSDAQKLMEKMKCRVLVEDKGVYALSVNSL